MSLTRCCYCVPLHRGCEVIAGFTIIFSILEVITISPIVKPGIVAAVVLVYLIIIVLSAFFIYAIEKRLIFIIYIFAYIYSAYAVISIAMAVTLQVQGKHFMAKVLKQTHSSKQLQEMAETRNTIYFIMFFIYGYFIIVIYSFYRQERFAYDENDGDESL